MLFAFLDDPGAVKTAMDPMTTSVLSLIGALGSSGAAVAVTWFFLGYLEKFGAKMTQAMSDRDTKHSEAMAIVAEQLNRIDDQHQKTADRWYAGSTEALKDNAAAMREVRQGLNQICRANSVPVPHHQPERRA